MRFKLKSVSVGFKLNVHVAHNLFLYIILSCIHLTGLCSEILCGVKHVDIDIWSEGPREDDNNNTNTTTTSTINNNNSNWHCIFQTHYVCNKNETGCIDNRCLKDHIMIKSSYTFYSQQPLPALFSVFFFFTMENAVAYCKLLINNSQDN